MWEYVIIDHICRDYHELSCEVQQVKLFGPHRELRGVCVAS